MFKNIVMVCTGNICRSPYAEAALAARATHLNVSSAGLSAMVDQGADETAIEVSRARGLYLDTHQPRQMKTSIMASSDLIMVMDDGHMERLLRRYPEARGKTFKLGKWLGDKDIVDPYLRNAEFFELVYNEIDRAIESWLPRLSENLSSSNQTN